MIARALPSALLVLALLCQSYIDLELAIDLGGWHANAPVTDILALALIPWALWGWATGRRLPLPGAAGYGLMLLAGALSAQYALDPHASLHTLVRKPLFMFMAYGFGAAWVVAWCIKRRGLGWAIVAWLTSTAATSLFTSAGRVLAGDALWFHAIEGLTPNHKTLAVSLAGGLPLLAMAPRTPAIAAGLVVVVAIGLSASKTAWLMTALAVGLFWPRRRPLAWRWKIAAPTAAIGLALAYYAPLLVGSRTMLDAARSRHSLNRRAWTMFRDRPLIGQGPGMSPAVELVTFPDYRVNGIDAHGVFQKVSGEMGAIGLIGYGWFSMSTFLGLRRRWNARGGDIDDVSYAALACWGVSSAGLLLSTETFSQTWWLPVGVSWGLAHAPEERRCAS
ncbi:MAG: O-antigen ligase family protein [Myxococcota bacterium]